MSYMDTLANLGRRVLILSKLGSVQDFEIRVNA